MGQYDSKNTQFNKRPWRCTMESLGYHIAGSMRMCWGDTMRAHRGDTLGGHCIVRTVVYGSGNVVDPFFNAPLHGLGHQQRCLHQVGVNQDSTSTHASGVVPGFLFGSRIMSGTH